MANSPQHCQLMGPARVHFEELGCPGADLASTAEELVFDGTVTLRDPQAKIENAEQKSNG